LADALDPERLAGALLESGAAAIYRGDFEFALRRAFELQYRRGRYAIPRWQSWGAWLEAVARCHLGLVDEADAALLRARNRFEDEGYVGALADLDTVTLLVQRVRLANGLIGVDELRPHLNLEEGSPLKRGDRLLVQGEVELARGTDEGVEIARQHYSAVSMNPSCPVAAAWAELGLAEVARRSSQINEADSGFEAVRLLARERGALWMEAQAVVGLVMSGVPTANTHWAEMRRRLPNHPTNLAEIAVGDPRILWTLMT